MKRPGVRVVLARVGQARKAAVSIGILLLACAIFVLLAWPVRAAIELQFLTAISTDTSVLIEWGTVSEFNVSGYEILCKLASEPESAYHPIGSRIATGGPDQAAAYEFNVTSNIEPGESYCFRIKEITTDLTPGEQFDICGYGPGVTPTIMPAGGVITGTVSPTTTVVIVSPEGVGPAPTLQGTPTATLAGGVSPLSVPDANVTVIVTPFPTSSPSPSPTFSPTMSPTPTATQPTSPLSAGDQNSSAAAANVGNATLTVTPQSSLTITPAVTPTASPTGTPTATATIETQAADSPLATLVATATITPTQAGAELPGVPGIAAENPTPTPIYQVVTATPTAQAIALAPTFTPLPMASPTPAPDVLSFFAPTTQNMMIMLLCLIFLSATGLGTLGLVTTIVYMRSHGQRKSLPRPSYYDPRRRF